MKAVSARALSEELTSVGSLADSPVAGVELRWDACSVDEKASKA